MAAPNVANLTLITSKTAFANASTTVANLVANPASSGKVFKINSLVISNIDGAASADIRASFYPSDAVDYYFAYDVTVPAKASLVVISKDNSIYLEEDTAIRILGSAAGDLQAICSYEEIS